MWVLLLTTHGCLATFSGGAGTFRVAQPHIRVSCTRLCPPGCIIHLPCPWHTSGEFPGGSWLLQGSPGKGN